MFGDFGKYLINFVLIVVAFVVVQKNPGVAWILAGVAAFLLFFFRGREAIILFSLYFAFEEFLLLHSPPESLLLLKYLGDILILAIFFAVSGKLALRRYNLEALKDNPVHLAILLFFICAITSAIINEVPIYIAFISIRQLFRYIVIFYAIIITAHAEWTQTDLKNLAKIVLVLIFIQAVIGYAQIIAGPGSDLNFFLLEGNQASLGDVPFVHGILSYASGKALYGSMINTNVYGLFLALGICLLFGIYVLMEGPGKRGMLVLLIFLAIPMLKSYSRQSIIGAFLGIFVIAFFRKEIRIIFLMAIVVGLFTLYLRTIKNKADWDDAGRVSIAMRIVSPFHAKYLEKYKDSDRLLIIRKILPKIINSPQGALGFGPGSLGSPFGFFKRYVKAYQILQIPQNYWLHIHTGIADVGFASIIGQYGLIGFALFLSIFILLFKTLLTKILPEMTDIFFKGITLGVIAYTATLFFSNLAYNNLTVRQISFYFWVMTAIVCAVRFTHTKEGIEPRLLENAHPPAFRQRGRFGPM